MSENEREKVKEKLDGYLSQTSLSNFAQDNYWDLVNKLKRHPSENRRLFVIETLQDYCKNSYLAQKGLALFLGDQSEKVINAVLSQPDSLSCSENYELLYLFSQQKTSRWNQKQMQRLYQAMVLSNFKKFENWIGDLFIRKTFLKKGNQEEEKDNVIQALVNLGSKDSYRILEKLFKKDDFKLSNGQRETILKYRETTRVRKRKREESRTRRREKKDSDGIFAHIRVGGEERRPGDNTEIEIPSFSDESDFSRAYTRVGKAGKESRATKANKKEAKKKKLSDIEKKLSRQIPRAFDGYEIEEVVGVGGMGVVLRARQKKLDRVVAIKLMHHAYDPDLVERFLREAKIAAKLLHPNVVQVFDYGVISDMPYFVMEYIDGFSLAEVISRYQELKFVKAVEIIRQIAGALDYAHDLDIVHRDVKPANIMTSSQGVVKVLDFGLAKLSSSFNDLTQSGVVLGTPNYMSPEQAQAQKIDRRADVYSLGVLFFELVTGSLPFSGESPMIVLYKHISDSPPHPGQFTSNLPSQMAKIILKCLAKSPDERYQDVGEFMEALLTISNSEETPLPTEEGKARALAVAQASTEIVIVPEEEKKKIQKALADSGQSAMVVSEEEVEEDFLSLYGSEAERNEPREEKKEIRIRSSQDFLSLLVLELYKQRPSRLLQILREYFENSSLEAPPARKKEKEELLLQLCEMADKNILVFLGTIIDEASENFSSMEKNMVEMVLRREGYR